MKYSLCLGVILACLALISSCAASPEEARTTEHSSGDYLVQFEEGTSRKQVESILSRNGVSRFSYVTSSRERGYIVLISPETGKEAIVTPLEHEERVDNVAPNFTRSIDRE
jgi:hypothetical protein